MTLDLIEWPLIGFGILPTYGQSKLFRIHTHLDQPYGESYLGCVLVGIYFRIHNYVFQISIVFLSKYVSISIIGYIYCTNIALSLINKALLHVCA